MSDNEDDIESLMDFEGVRGEGFEETEEFEASWNKSDSGKVGGTFHEAAQTKVDENSKIEAIRLKVLVRKQPTCVH